MSISVVIPVLAKTPEKVSMTLKCINLAKQNTQVPYETVIVETASNHLADYADIYVYEKEVTNATKSINRGFKVASGDYIVLLTNDVFVKPRWLECLVDCFKKEDCGLATLATTQFNHQQEDKITEGVWFSIAMLPKSIALFDENYCNSWDDTDIVMRTYLQNKKMYRNYNCVVDHLIGKTQYERPDHQENFIKNREYFIKKYQAHSDNRMYKILTEGTVL